MKRPAFNVASITQGKTNMSTNNTEVMAVDDKGNTQIINISPKSKDQLVRVLLSAAPFGTPEQDAKSTKAFLVATNTRCFESPNGTIGLEVHLGPGIAVHILLPGLLPEALEQQLRQFQKPVPAQSH